MTYFENANWWSQGSGRYVIDLQEKYIRYIKFTHHSVERLSNYASAANAQFDHGEHTLGLVFLCSLNVWAT